MHQCSNRPNFDVDLRTTFTRACTFRQDPQLLDINDTIKERGVSVDIRSIIVHHIRLGGSGSVVQGFACFEVTPQDSQFEKGNLACEETRQTKT